MTEEGCLTYRIRVRPTAAGRVDVWHRQAHVF